MVPSGARFTAIVAIWFVSGWGCGVNPTKPIPTKCTRCTRCDRPQDRDCMMVYALDGKPDILLCKRCVYEQAENFIRFCPVLEEQP